MKKILVVLACANLFLACKSGDSNSEEEKSEKKISSRDYSINAAMAYNDIFLDSLTVAAFVDTADVSDKIKRRMTSFYNARNYQFAWFASDGLNEQGRGFWNLYHYHSKYIADSLPKDKKFQAQMNELFGHSSFSVSNTDKNTIQTELMLTRLFIKHGLEIYEDGYVKRKEMERFVPLKKVDPLKYADSLLTKKHKNDKYFEDINESYKSLKLYLGKYMEVAKNGGWPSITMNEKSIKPGASSPAIVAIKRRLQLSGEYNGQDTTAVYDPSLEVVIKSFQQSHGFTPDGIIAANTIKQLNVPVDYKIRQLLINLDRMRWMPNRPKGNLILVNIPAFVMHVMEGEKKVFDINVVVGKEGNNTVMFTDDLNQIVFSPYWNIPSSIVKEEILPAINRNPNYIASQNMEIVSDKGELPVIRQLPGRGNALGKVKFLFPNSFNIYFHDTPSKSLFKRDQRAFSHGCIRIEEPEKMANYLLRDDADWTPEKINAAMNSGSETTVKLKKKVPVFITYYTAWVDEHGKLNFREDIYGHDEKVMKKLFDKPANIAMVKQ